MSYPKDLDEQSDLAILQEAIRRIELIAADKCTYCQKPTGECGCKMRREIGQFAIAHAEAPIRTTLAGLHGLVRLWNFVTLPGPPRIAPGATVAELLEAPRYLNIDREVVRDAFRVTAALADWFTTRGITDISPAIIITDGMLSISITDDFGAWCSEIDDVEDLTFDKCLAKYVEYLTKLAKAVIPDETQTSAAR